jgi:hypothetical protein
MTKMPRVAAIFAAVLMAALVAGGTVPSSASAISSADAIARVNALRAANGIPGDLVEDPALSAGCQAHSRYAALNGGFDAGSPHDETDAKPGYTAEGAAAAGHSVLGSAGWTDPTPWSSAPAHLRQVLNPWLARTGYGEEGGYVCLQTIVRPSRQLPPYSLFTFPGPGVTGVPPSTTVGELDESGKPLNPGASAGVPAGATTGPYIIVYAGDVFGSGEGVVEAASLTGPGGAVELAVTTNGDFLIPRKPLAPFTVYTAAVTVRFSGHTCMPVGSPSGAAHLTTCPPDVPAWCHPNPQAAAAYGVRVCDAGEPEPPALHVYPDQVASREWTFTTGGESGNVPHSGRRASRCRPLLYAPRRVRAGTRLAVRYRACGPATISAVLSRTASRTVRRRSVRIGARRRGRLILSLRKVRAGRYRLRARIDADRRRSLSLRITVTRGH